MLPGAVGDGYIGGSHFDVQRLQRVPYRVCYIESRGRDPRFSIGWTPGFIVPPLVRV